MNFKKRFNNLIRQARKAVFLKDEEKFAEEYGFGIELESELRKGAHFKLVFPPSPEPG